MAYGDPPSGALVTVVGWGQTSDAFPDAYSDVLREADNPILDYDSCLDFYHNLDELQLCTDTTGGVGACQVSCFVSQSPGEYLCVAEL